MTKEIGRLDYMSNFGCYKIIGYFGKKDIEVGRCPNKETAWQILHDWYESNKYVIDTKKAR